MKKRLLFLISLLTLLFVLPGLVQAMEFKKTKGTKISYDGSRYLNVLADGNRKVRFVLQPDGNLALKDRSTDQVYLVFKPFTPEPSGMKYMVYKIEGKKPNQVFFEVNAFDEMDYNIGFWIVGQYKGKWVTYVSTDNLMKMGFNPNLAHVLYPTTDSNGFYVIGIFQPDDDPYGSGGYYDDNGNPLKHEMNIALYWDNKAQWFSMHKV